MNANDNHRGNRNDHQLNGPRFGARGRAGRKPGRGKGPAKDPSTRVPSIPSEWAARLLREGKTMTVTFDGVSFVAMVGDETLTQWVRSQQDAEASKALADRKRVVAARLAGLDLPVPDMGLVVSDESLADYISALPVEAGRIIRMNADSFRAYMRAQIVASGATQTAVAAVGGLANARARLAALTGREIPNPGE